LLLVAAGADINASMAASDGVHFTALMRSVDNCCCPMALDILLQAGADPCVRISPKFITALHAAAMAGAVRCCELLLAKAETLLEVRDYHDWTALMYVAHGGRVEVAQLLIQRGADVNMVDSLGVTPLMKASLQKYAEVALCLLQAGADVSVVDHSGHCALQAAVQSNSTELAQLLLDHGADINATDNEGYNCLFKAVEDGHVPMIKLLVQRGLNVHAVNSKGHTLLMIAAGKGHKAAAEWLIQQGVAVNTADNQGKVCLHGACSGSSSDDAAMIELLLNNGADVHQYSDKQISALDTCAEFGKVECARALIAAGADVNHFNSMNVTCLHVAVMMQHTAVVQLLLEHGATAVMNSAVINTAVAIECDYVQLYCRGKTAPMMCTEAHTVKLLLAAGADVHVTNDVGDTCLHVAAKQNYTAPVLCLLIKAGADLHAVNNEGKTAAQLMMKVTH
jgi:ankyrin repeat protein